MRWTGPTLRMCEMRNAHQILVGKPSRDNTYETNNQKNITVDLEEMGLDDVNWIQTPQDTVRPLTVSCEDGTHQPSGFIQGGEFLTNWETQFDTCHQRC